MRKLKKIKSRRNDFVKKAKLKRRTERKRGNYK